MSKHGHNIPGGHIKKESALDQRDRTKVNKFRKERLTVEFTNTLAENAEIEWEGVTDPRYINFLNQLSLRGLVREACKATGIAHTTPHRWAKKDEAFRDAFLEAKGKPALDVLEGEAFRRAVDGTEETVYHQGERIGSRMVYSDALLALLLKAAAPEKYMNRSTVTAQLVDTRDSVPVVSDDKETLIEVAQVLRLLPGVRPVPDAIEDGEVIEAEVVEISKEGGDDVGAHS